MSRRRTSRPQPAGDRDKGLKKNAIGFVSSVVIGVASTAPGYSLAATLGFVAAVVGLGCKSPAILLISFIPMFLVAAAYYYMNKADPDCGTSFSWVTKAMGPQLGWMAGWAIVVADVRRDGQPGPDRRPLLASSSSAGRAAAESTVAVTAGRRPLDRADDLDRGDRDRALRPHPGRPARRRRSSPWRCSRSSPWSRSTRAARRRARSTRRSPGSTPSRSASARSRPGCCSRSSSIGAGTRPRRVNEETEDSSRGARQGDRDQHPDPARRSTSSSPSPRRPTAASTTWSRTRKTCSAPRHRGLRLAARQAADHRRPHLGGGLDPDDDPADRADDALDGAGESAAGQPRQDPPPLPDPAHLDDPDGRALDRLVRRPDDRQRRHPLRQPRGARADDRLLPRHHRLRLRRSTTAASCCAASRTSSSSASGRPSAG